METNHLIRIDEIWAAVSVDETGHEGLCAFFTGSGWMPLIAADEKRLVEIRRIAKDLALQRQIKIKLIRLADRSELETWDGRQ